MHVVVVVVVVVVVRYLNFMNTANHSSSHNCRSFARNSREFHRWVWCHYHPWYSGSSHKWTPSGYEKGVRNWNWLLTMNSSHTRLRGCKG